MMAVMKSLGLMVVLVVTLAGAMSAVVPAGAATAATRSLPVCQGCALAEAYTYFPVAEQLLVTVRQHPLASQAPCR